VAGLRTQLERSGENPRAAVLDLDVHFGDGTAWQFYDDASVLTVSVHLDQSEAGQFPYLKGSARERGDGDGRGTWMWAGSIGVVGRYGWAFIASAWGVQSFAVHPFAVGIESLWELITRACVARNHWTKQGANINLPIKEGMGDAHAWALLQQCAFPAIQAHAPHVLFVAFGTDGLRGDPTEVRQPVTPTSSRRTSVVCRWYNACPPKRTDTQERPELRPSTAPKT
jgi:acetoin utilization deacetylase AcuC-like enzyme